MKKPSLALIPSGYKASKIYSILPNNGDGDFTFSRSSTATRVNKDGLIETVASNIPRLDYTDGGCPSLLLEPQRTNLVPYSEDFSNAAWIKNNVTLTLSDEISPTGELNAYKMEGGASTPRRIFDGLSTTIGQDYTYSLYVKKGNTDSIFFMTSSGSLNCTFDLDALTATNGTIEDVGNGWYRLSSTASATVTSEVWQILLSSADAQGTFHHIFGGQVEQSDYATSYIPTNGSAATRLRDQCVNNDLDFIIQDEGSVYWEGSIQGETPILIQLSPDTGIFSNTIYIEYASSVNQLRMRVYDSGVLQSFFSTTVQKNTIYKIALGYKENDIVGVVNGSIIGTDASALIQSGLSNVNIGELRGVTNDAYNGVTLKKALLYDKRLSNEELQELTTI